MTSDSYFDSSLLLNHSTPYWEDENLDQLRVLSSGFQVGLAAQEREGETGGLE